MYITEREQLSKEIHSMFEDFYFNNLEQFSQIFTWFKVIDINGKPKCYQDKHRYYNILRDTWSHIK